MKKFKYRRSYYRVFSVFIALVMIVLSVPFSATAQEISENETDLAASIGAPYGWDHTDTPTQKSPEVLAADAEAMRREQLIQNGIDPDQPLQSNSTAQLVQGGEELEPLSSYAKVLDDGVYAIQSVANSGYFMKVEHPEWLAGYHIQQQSANASTILSSFNTRYLFKLTQHPDTGSYIIRPMYNNALSIEIVTFSDGSRPEVLTKDIQLDDAAVPYSDTYVLSASGSGFKMRKYGTTNCLAVNGLATNLTATFEIGDNLRWTFTKYTGAERNSAVMLYNSLPTVGQSTTLIPVIYSTRPGYNMPYLDMSQIPSTSYYISGPNEYGRFSLTPHDGPDWTFHIYVKNGAAASAPMVYASQQDFKITLPIDEGTYFFNNVKYDDKYMQIDDDVSPSANGAIMELWDFDADDDQRWELDHISDGKYKILSVESGKALTAPSSVNGSVTQKTYTGATNQLWYITANTNGSYTLTNSTYYLAAGDGIFTSDGRNVEGRAEQSDAKDEWNLYRQDLNIVNVEVIYDLGYLSRYSNATTRIQSAMITMQEKFLSEFGIWVNYYTPTSYISYGDQCSTNHSSICEHAEDEQCYNSNSYNDLAVYHHKNIFNILERIPRPDTASSIKVAFIGHDNCETDRDNAGNFVKHNENPFFGLAYPYQGLACVMNFDGVAQEKKTLTHEFGHLFGVIDHYGEEGYTTTQMQDMYPNSGYSQYCIYGEKRNNSDVYQNLTICNGCKERIRENIDLYDHS